MPSPVVEDLTRGESFTDVPLLPAESETVKPLTSEEISAAHNRMREAFKAKGIEPPPLAPGEKEVVPPAAKPDPFAGEKQVDAFHGEQEVKDAFSGERQADALDERSPDDLAKDPNFKIHDFIFANKNNIFNDPKRYQKALDTYRESQANGATFEKTKESVKKETLPLLKDILKSVPKRLENLSDIAVAPLVDAVTEKFRGERLDPEKHAQWEAMTEDAKEAAIAEATAGTQTAVGSLQDLVRQGARKLVGPAFGVGGKKDWREISDDELKNELFKDLGWRETVEGLARGEGVKDLVSEGVQLNPENIKLLSLTDPITLIGTGVGLKAVSTGGRIIFTAANEAGANAALSYLGRQAGTAAAKGAQLIGQGVEATGQGIAKALPISGHGAGTAAFLHILGVPGKVIGAARLAAPVIRKAGQLVREVGEAAGAPPEGQLSLGLEPTTGSRVLSAAKTAAAFVKPPVAGALEGAATTAPLAFASDEPQGGLLGVGAVGGAVHGGLRGVKEAVAERGAKKYFDPGQIKWEKTSSPGYEGFDELNKAHEAVSASTPENARNMVDSLRETLRPFGKKLFLVDDAAYEKAIEQDTIRANGGNPLTPEQKAAVADEARTRGVSKIGVADAAGNVENVTLVKSSADAPHEFSHVLESVMDPAAREALHDAVREAYTPEELDALRKHYEQQIGRPFTPEEARSEFIADNWANLLYNTPLESMGLPQPKPGFRARFLDAAVGLGNALGLDMTAGRKTPGLGLKPSYSLRKALVNASEKIIGERDQLAAQQATAPAVPEVKPAETPAPAAPVEVPVKPAETAQGELPLFEQPSEQPKATPEATPPAPAVAPVTPAAAPSARRAEVTNTHIADNWAAGKENQPAIAEVNAALDENVGLRVEHAGAPKVTYKPTEPERAAEVEEGRGLPPEQRELHAGEKYPTRWEQTKSGEPQLIARSVDKVMSNVDRAVQWAKAAGENVPWETDAAGTLTSAGADQLLKDLNTYWDNQDRGFRGGGEKLVRPSEKLGASIPAERGEGAPLGTEKEQWLNLLQGKDVGPPETARASRGQLPANIKAQEIRAAQGLESERLAPGTEIPVYPEKVTGGRGAVEVKETNPLRNRMRAAGMPVGDLHTVVERLNAADIAKAERAPELQGRGGATDIARAGFLTEQPVEKTIDDVTKATPEQWQKFFGPGSTLTPSAYDLGLGLKNPADLKALMDAQDAATKTAQASLAEVRAGNFDALDRASADATKAQFFREAVEAATDTGSAAGPAGWRKIRADRTPPFSTPESRQGFLTEEQPLTPESEFKKEADFAKEVIAGAKRIEDYPFYDSYKKTLADEAKLVDDGSVVFVGSGPMPISQILLEENLGRRVDGLDIAPEAVEVGNQVLDKAGVEGRMYSGAGEEARLGDYDNVVVALDAGTTPKAKGEILANVHSQVKPDATVLVRSSMDKSFPQVGDSYKGLFTVEDRVPTFDGLSETLKLKKMEEEPLRDPNVMKKFLTAEEMPEDVDPIVQAAIRTREGKIYTGAWHGEAMDKIAEERGIADPDKVMALYDNGELTDGFVSKSGKFFNRADAADHATKIKQLKQPLVYGKSLESQEFAGKRAFLAEEDIKPSDESKDWHVVWKPRPEGKTVIRQTVNATNADEATQKAGIPEGAKHISTEPVYAPGNTHLPERGGYLPKKRETAAEKADREETERLAKYNVPAEQKPKGDKPTGWILPNGDFVSLDTDYHQSWLGENADKLNAQFKTSFSPEATVEDRLAALNAGFVRAREYGGKLVVEANQNFFKGAQKRAIEDLLDNNAENVDHVSVTLLNNDGQVTDSVNARLFDADDPRQAVSDALDRLNPKQTTAKRGPTAIQIARAREGYLPAKEKLTPATAEAAAHKHNEDSLANFPEVLPTRFVRDSKGKLKLQGGKLVAADEEAKLDETPLAKDAVAENPDKFKVDVISDALANKIVAEAKSALKDPEVKKGLTWYDDAVKLIKKAFGNDAGLFAQLLAATSPRNGVQVNFQYAIDAWNAVKRGEYEPFKEKYLEGREQWKTGGTPAIAEWEQETGKKWKAGSTVAAQALRNNFLTWWVDKHDILPKREGGKLYGMHSFPVLDVISGTWLDDVAGPKVRNFLANLTGEGHDATIDIWATRFLSRISQSADSLKGRWRVAPPAGEGISPANFELAQLAFRKAADKMGVKPDALQALVWFSEKQLWEQNNWTAKIGAAKSDYAYWLQGMQPAAHPGTYNIPEEVKMEARRQAAEERTRTAAKKQPALDIPVNPVEE